MSFFGFGQSVDVDILLNDADSRRRAEHKTEDGKKDKYFLFYDGETVSGKVSLALKNPNKRLEHQGIKVEFIGQIELYYDRGNHHEFVSLVKDLARPGEVTQSQAFDFEFTHVEKPYESYTGQNVKLRLENPRRALIPGPLGCVMSPGLLAPGRGHHLPGACVGDRMGPGEVSPLLSEDGLQALLFQPLQGGPSAKGAPFTSAL